MSQKQQPGVRQSEGQQPQQRGGIQGGGIRGSKMGQPGQETQGGGGGQGQQLTGRFFPTQNYLPEEVRTASVRLLNQVLADTTVLVTHAKAAHWNVKGPNFFALHELFEEIYEDLSEHADDVAERVTALGGEAKGTTRIAASNTRIPGLPGDAVTGQEYVQLLAERLAIHDANLSEGIRFATRQDDPDTADLLNEVSREITKDLWFLEAHLQTQPISGTGGQQGSMGQQPGGFQQGGGQQQGQQSGGQQQPGGGFQQGGGQFQQPVGQGQGQQPTGQEFGGPSQPGGQQPQGPGGQQRW